MNRLARLAQISYQANVPKFFVFRFVRSLHFYLPIWVIFLQQERGFTLTQITLMDTAFWLAMALGEIPTGAIADTFGRKHSLIIGVLLSATAIILYVSAPTYPLLLFANILWGLAITFDSGAAMALLYSSLHELGREGEYTRLRGRLAAVDQGAIAISSALGGVLGAHNLAWPFLVYAGLLLASLSLVILLKEPPQELEPSTGKPLSYAEILRLTARMIRQPGDLRYVLLYSGMLPLASATVNIVFLQPHALALGVPIAAIGFLLLGLQGAQMAGAAASDRLVTRLGESTWLWIVPVVICLGMIGLGTFNSLAGIVPFALVGFATAATTPMIENVILRQAPRSVRATILSVDALVFRLLLAVVEPAMGWLADLWGLPMTFLILGIVTSAGLLGVLHVWSRSRHQQRLMERP
jgi:MFS family permease